MTSTKVFEKVAAGLITPAQGAELLMQERDQEKDWRPRQPKWMPRWLYVVSIVALSFLVVPLLLAMGGVDRRS